VKISKKNLIRLVEEETKKILKEDELKVTFNSARGTTNLIMLTLKSLGMLKNTPPTSDVQPIDKLIVDVVDVGEALKITTTGMSGDGIDDIKKLELVHKNIGRIMQYMQADERLNSAMYKIAGENKGTVR